MSDEKLIVGATEDEVWQQIEADFAKDDSPFEYYVVIEQNNQKTILDIDIDPGGGFEGGYATTTFRAPINVLDDFKFALHEEGFLDEVGKFFGMQDVVLGYPEFDKKLIVKTNDEARAKAVFADASVREFIQSLKSFTLHISHKTDDDVRQSFLDLTIEEGITDTQKLRQIYHVFYKVATALEIK